MKWPWEKPDREPPAILRMSPAQFTDASEIVTLFGEGQAIILDLTAMDLETSRRMLDFVCGAVFLAEGRVIQLSLDVYLLVPLEVEFSDLLLRNGEVIQRPEYEEEEEKTDAPPSLHLVPRPGEADKEPDTEPKDDENPDPAQAPEEPEASPPSEEPDGGEGPHPPQE